MGLPNLLLKWSCYESYKRSSKGIKKNKRIVLIGHDARVFDLLTRVMPNTYMQL